MTNLRTPMRISARAKKEVASDNNRLVFVSGFPVLGVDGGPVETAKAKLFCFEDEGNKWLPKSKCMFTETNRTACGGVKWYTIQLPLWLAETNNLSYTDENLEEENYSSPHQTDFDDIPF